MANPKLKEKLAELPASPGVYIMRDADGQVVYVGKAKSLKQRVRSYFQDESRLAPKTAAQMRVVEELEYVHPPKQIEFAKMYLTNVDGSVYKQKMFTIRKTLKS